MKEVLHKKKMTMKTYKKPTTEIVAVNIQNLLQSASGLDGVTTSGDKAEGGLHGDSRRGGGWLDDDDY